MQLGQFETKRKKRLCAGFTLIEGVLGVGIVGMLIMALYTGMTSGFGVVAMARENLRATQVMQEKFEAMRLYTWDQINDPVFIPSTFTAPLYTGSSTNSTYCYYGKVKISQADITEPYGDDLRKITIQLTWDTGKTTRTRTMSSYVARYGMQNYVY